MRRECIQRVDQNGDPLKPDPGFWSGDLGGMLYQLGKAHECWFTGGAEMAWFLERRRRAGHGVDPILLPHSHGLQCAAYGLSMLDPRVGWEITLIDVDGPVRRDMRHIYVHARGKVKRWVHLHTGTFTKMRMLGSRFGPVEMSIADVNRRIEGGHSGILREPAYMDQWPAILKEVL